ncbi:uncharacterized protein LOC141863586 isoform X3 [Acropora palmata]|uniref:uncharacterized protein LOC141863586 isoform X3 n=1 Tax=Acropora palmata TaxID=6131 RepID=UPI003DA04D3A
MLKSRDSSFAVMVKLILLLVFALQGFCYSKTPSAPAGQSCWTNCTKTCGGGIQVTCANNTAKTKACNTMRCPGDPEWTKCTLTCGGGMQTNVDNSSIMRTCNTMSCPGDAGCLSAYLSFEHLFNNIVYDESHNGNAGTLHGSAKIVQNGKFGKGLQLTEDGNVTFDLERFHNRPTDAITVSLWLKLSAVNGSRELFFTCGTPELYNMGDYHFAVQSGKVHWLEELPGGDTRFNVLSRCPELAKSEYLHRRDKAASYLHWNICKELNINVEEKWYEHEPQTVTERDNITILWDMPIQTDREIKANRPDIVIKDKQEKSCLLIDMSIPTEKNTSVKVTEKLSKYKDLEIEIERMWGMKATTIPVVIGALGLIKKGLGEIHQTNPG